MAAHTGSGSPALAPLSARRLAARLARANAEASVERLYSEPLRSDADLNIVVRLLAASRRFALAVMARYHHRPAHLATPALRVFTEHVQATLRALSETLRGAPARLDQLPDLRADQLALKDATAHNGTLIVSYSDQIANAVNTMTQLVRKLRL